MIFSAVGTTILALGLAWLFGGLVLRLGGALVVLAGVLGLAINGDPNGIVVVAVGALAWLAGQGHHALRHHAYKSPLARYVFCRWAPAWLDPTRNWAVAAAPESADRDADGERGRRP